MSGSTEKKHKKACKNKDSYHHGDLKTALIQAGIRLLHKSDGHEFSLREVAKEAGVSHAAPYRHFSDKETLMAAIAHLGFVELGDKIETALSKNKDNIKDWVPLIAKEYLNFAIKNPAQFKMMVGGFVTDPQKFEEFDWVGKKLFERFVEVIKLCQSAKVIKEGDPQLIVLSFWSLMHGFVVLYSVRQLDYFDINKTNVSSILEQMISVVLS